MKPHLISLKNPEPQKSIIVDMEGPYHRKNKRIGEHMYGATLLIDNVPYHIIILFYLVFLLKGLSIV